jgi:hypothetical protein
MQRFPEYSFKTLPAPPGGPQRPSQAATRVYQGVTIAAMLLLLCSLWAF